MSIEKSVLEKMAEAEIELFFESEEGLRTISDLFSNRLQKFLTDTDRYNYQFTYELQKLANKTFEEMMGEDFLGSDFNINKVLSYGLIKLFEERGYELKMIKKDNS